MKKAKTRKQRAPSATSLREAPEIDFSPARVRRNSYAVRIAREGITVQVGRGRPKKPLEVGGTRPRSVRFPDVVWKQIEARARMRASRCTPHSVRQSLPGSCARREMWRRACECRLRPSAGRGRADLRKRQATRGVGRPSGRTPAAAPSAELGR
jgi:hypothetical protein